MATASRALLSRAALSPLHAVAAARRIPLLLRPLAAAATLLPAASDAGRGAMRCYSTQPATSSMRDSSPNWNNRPPKETILLDGCDFEHWLVVMDPPPGDPANPDPTRDEIIDSYIKTLAQVVGSEEEARHKIYSVSTRHYFAFGALVSEELSYKIKELPRVRWVLPDSYLDVKNKDYGGEPFINGEAVPYDPKYHEEWVRNNARANERSRRNDRPRNFDRSRNFERRRENQQNFQNRDVPPGPNGPPPPGGPGFSGPPPPGGPGFSGPPPPGGLGFSGPPPPGGPAFSGPPPPGGPGFSGPPPPGGPGFNGPPPPGRPGFNGPPAPGQGMPPPNYQPQMPNPQVGYNQQGGAPYQGGNQGYQGNPGQAYQGGATGYQGPSYQGGNPNAPNYQGGGNTGYGGNGQGYPGQNGY